MAAGNLDRAVWDAQRRVSQCLLRMTSGNPPTTPEEMDQAIGDLNKAWDALTDALISQCEERDRQIRRLLDELAERPRREDG